MMSEQQVSLNTYLGQKGYTVLKKELTPEQYTQIKKELIAMPSTQCAPGQRGQQITFPIYRESPKKLYMPRYYGEKKFGKPKTLQISQGNTIDINFSGNLRENQKPIVDAYLSFVKSSQGSGGLLELSCGGGKTIISLYI